MAKVGRRLPRSPPVKKRFLVPLQGSARRDRARFRKRLLAEELLHVRQLPPIRGHEGDIHGEDRVDDVEILGAGDLARIQPLMTQLLRALQPAVSRQREAINIILTAFAYFFR